MNTNKRVLVVEDDADVREVVGMVLQSIGYESLPATNGKTALEILKNGDPPGLILTDIMMPVMSGWDFLKAKASDPALIPIPVVVLSAAEKRTLPPEARVFAFLPKPVDIEALIQTVQKYYGA